MTIVTALRTAAVSGLATRHLSRQDSSVMGMIGAGSQAVFQALAVRSQRPGVTRLRLFDVDRPTAETASRHLRSLGFEVTIEASAADAGRDADIITTCTADKTNATVLHLDEVPAGAHINAIGGDCPGKTELGIELVRRNRVFVEHTPQTRIEGEIQLLPADFPVTELWRVITGADAGRVSAEEVTVFDSVGFANRGLHGAPLRAEGDRGDALLRADRPHHRAGGSEGPLRHDRRPDPGLTLTARASPAIRGRGHPSGR